MSSKFKVLSFAIAAILAFGAFTAHADVTGSFSTHVSFTPQTTASEVSALDFDIQNAINLTVVISGLSTTLHSHFGIAGVEDVQLSYAATLGALDISGQFVFGRFTGVCNFPGNLLSADDPNCYLGVTNNTTPLTDDLLFVKKRVEMGISLGGVTFSNLAMFEDTNWPNQTTAVSHQTSDQEFAFGDVLSLSGQTPSGVSISAKTGICASVAPNVIKKHWWPYEVNPTCFADASQEPEQKPNLLFDFETLNISGIPIASGVTSSATVHCEKTTACQLTNTFNFSGVGPVPFSASFFFTDLFTFSFDSATLVFSTGPGTVEVDITSTGTIAAVKVNLSTTLNPDTNPATFTVDADFTPGVGLTDADVSLAISRSNVDFSINADFNPISSDTAEFNTVTFSIGTSLGSVDVNTSATFGAFGFVSSDSTFTINF